MSVPGVVDVEDDGRSELLQNILVCSLSIVTSEGGGRIDSVLGGDGRRPPGEIGRRRDFNGITSGSGSGTCKLFVERRSELGEMIVEGGGPGGGTLSISFLRFARHRDIINRRLEIELRIHGIILWMILKETQKL